MEQTYTNRTRILAVAPTTRGFGYLVLEGRREILAFGCKRAKGRTKNIKSVSQVGKLLEEFSPDILALQNVNAKDSRRVLRIKKLHQQFTEIAENGKIKVVVLSGKQMRIFLLNDPKGTKHEMSQAIAKLYPNELGKKLPPKRRAWDKEHEWMSIFDAAALALTFWKTGK